MLIIVIANRILSSFSFWNVVLPFKVLRNNFKFESYSVDMQVPDIAVSVCGLDI